MLWTPVPWAPTGYGKNSKNLALRLKETRHKVAIQSYVGLRYDTIEWNGIKVFPRVRGEKMGTNSIQYRNRKWQPDLIVQHFDVWTLGPNFLKEHPELPVASYTPVDHKPLPLIVRKAQRGAKEIIAMSKFAKKMYAKNNILSTYIPHAVETDVFKPVDKEKAREKVGVDKDKFMLLSVATNKGPRKNIPNTLRAYKKFIEDPKIDEDEVLFHLHTYPNQDPHNPKGFELPIIFNSLFDKPSRFIKRTAKHRYVYGLTDKEMNYLYNAADVLIQTTMAEGFGIPVIEAFATGTPVIMTDFTTGPELIGENEDRGWLVDVAELWPMQRTSAWQAVPDTEDIYKKMKLAYLDDKGRKIKGKKALKHAKQQYDWDYVFKEYWMPFFDKYERKYR